MEDLVLVTSPDSVVTCRRFQCHDHGIPVEKFGADALRKAPVLVRPQCALAHEAYHYHIIRLFAQVGQMIPCQPDCADSETGSAHGANHFDIRSLQRSGSKAVSSSSAALQVTKHPGGSANLSWSCNQTVKKCTFVGRSSWQLSMLSAQVSTEDDVIWTGRSLNCAMTTIVLSIRLGGEVLILCNPQASCYE